MRKQKKTSLIYLWFWSYSFLRHILGKSVLCRLPYLNQEVATLPFIVFYFILLSSQLVFFTLLKMRRRTEAPASSTEPPPADKKVKLRDASELLIAPCDSAASRQHANLFKSDTVLRSMCETDVSILSSADRTVVSRWVEHVTVLERVPDAAQRGKELNSIKTCFIRVWSFTVYSV